MQQRMEDQSAAVTSLAEERKAPIQVLAEKNLPIVKEEQVEMEDLPVEEDLGIEAVWIVKEELTVKEETLPVEEDSRVTALLIEHYKNDPEFLALSRTLVWNYHREQMRSGVCTITNPLIN